MALVCTDTGLPKRLVCIWREDPPGDVRRDRKLIVESYATNDASAGFLLFAHGRERNRKDGSSASDTVVKSRSLWARRAAPRSGREQMGVLCQGHALRKAWRSMSAETFIESVALSRDQRTNTMQRNETS